MCHVPNRAHLHPDPVSHYVTGDIHIPVPAIYGHTPDGHHDSTMDTFLCTLGEAEPVRSGSDVGGGRDRSPTRLKGQLETKHFVLGLAEIALILENLTCDYHVTVLYLACRTTETGCHWQLGVWCLWRRPSAEVHASVGSCLIGRTTRSPLFPLQ